eukprot:GHVT01038677.1.p1 GENE.GHVT01038677.1~~GHVT01038677.1.p1  ORF type:complete len:138 (-),score=12.66 GHVT01038677.1:2040-2453(-)
MNLFKMGSAEHGKNSVASSPASLVSQKTKDTAAEELQQDFRRISRKLGRHNRQLREAKHFHRLFILDPKYLTPPQLAKAGSKRDLMTSITLLARERLRLKRKLNVLLSGSAPRKRHKGVPERKPTRKKLLGRMTLKD